MALKLLPVAAAGDAVAVARFEREVAALGRCDHPNVVKVLATGEARGTYYYTMEYIEGADLSQVARELSEGSGFDHAVSTASDRLRAERGLCSPRRRWCHRRR